MADYGIKIMKSSKNITSSEPRDHILSSKYSSVKIIQETLGTIVISASGSAYATVTHNLGFEPLSIIYTETSPNKWTFGFPRGVSDVSYEPSPFEGDTIVGTSNIIIDFVNNTGSNGTTRYKVYVMGDSG